MRPILSLTLVVSLASTLASAQEARPEVKAPLVGSKRPIVSGRVLDGLGRPVPGVSVEVMDLTLPIEERLAAAQTDKDGRFSCRIDRELKKVRIGCEKKGYVYTGETLDSTAVAEITMPRKCDWDAFDLLPWTEGGALDQGMRELLASEDGPDLKTEGPFEVVEMDESNDPLRLHRFLFRYQEPLRPPIRRLVEDPHVGKKARRWLDWLGDPADRDLFPVKREYAPRHEIAEQDLVDAIKAISRHLNFFSSAPEPRISIDKLNFDEKLDRVMVECGINVAPFTGVFWHFIFHKDGNRWVLRSMEEAGRG